VAVFLIRDILVRIWMWIPILGSVPLSSGSGTLVFCVLLLKYIVLLQPSWRLHSTRTLIKALLRRRNTRMRHPPAITIFREDIKEISPPFIPCNPHCCVLFGAMEDALKSFPTIFFYFFSSSSVGIYDADTV
jgi:hypothetical protein